MNEREKFIDIEDLANQLFRAVRDNGCEPDTVLMVYWEELGRED